MMWNLVVIFLAILFYCMKVDYFKHVDPVNYSVNLPDKLDGPLKPNDHLDKAEFLFEKAVHWPESFAVEANDIYTGLGDGRIVRITGDKMVTVCRTGKECAGQHEEHICGRPLGLEFYENGKLFVVDAYYGLFTVDTKTGEKDNILPSSTVVDKLSLQFLNDLAINKKTGDVYITQSSTKWDIGNVLTSIVEHDSSGRLLKYNLKSKQVSVLLTNLSFPNGVVISDDGTSLLVAEGNKNKIFKYFLEGPKKGTHVDFTVNLPGEPDNISKNMRGNYWVGISTGRSKENPALHDRFAEQPFLRKAFLFATKVFNAPFVGIMNLIPHKCVNEIAFELSTLRIIADIPMNHGMIVEIDKKGNIVRSLQSPSGKVAHISEVLEHNGYLYLGSWRNKYLGRVKL